MPVIRIHLFTDSNLHIYFPATQAYENSRCLEITEYIYVCIFKPRHLHIWMYKRNNQSYA